MIALKSKLKEYKEDKNIKLCKTLCPTKSLKYLAISY